MKMFNLSDGRTHLYQYDTSRILEVSDDITTVHMSNLPYGNAYVCEVENGICQIPDQLLQSPGTLFVWSFLGTADDGFTKHEEYIDIIKKAKPLDYTFTPSEQESLGKLRKDIGNLDELETKAKSNLVNAINEVRKVQQNGIDGIQGEKGEKGDKGEQGNDGYTPVKGVDYFTDSDVKQIVDEVLAEIPVGNEVSY